MGASSVNVVETNKDKTLKLNIKINKLGQHQSQPQIPNKSLFQEMNQQDPELKIVLFGFPSIFTVWMVPH